MKVITTIPMGDSLKIVGEGTYPFSTYLALRLYPQPNPTSFQALFPGGPEVSDPIGVISVMRKLKTSRSK
jgi:hypothetical protein